MQFERMLQERRLALEQEMHGSGRNGIDSKKTAFHSNILDNLQRQLDIATKVMFSLLLRNIYIKVQLLQNAKYTQSASR